MKSKIKEQKGITLVALVVTIIILLTLAGVAISVSIGDNGLFKKAQEASEINKRAGYLEELTLIADNLQIDKAAQDLSGKDYIDKFEKELEDKTKEGGTLGGSSTIRKDDETLRVITPEGYVYDVTPEGVNYIGKQGDKENQPPEIKQGDIIFTPSHTTPINGDITVEITTSIDIAGYYLQYSKDSKSWKPYTEPVKLTENGKVYARVANVLDESKGFAETEITIIDKIYPEILTLTADTSNDTITGKAKDEGTGINGYAFSKTADLENNLESTEWKAVEATIEEVTYTYEAGSTGTYYFYVKDQANNVSKQSVSIEVIPKVIYLGAGTSFNVTAVCQKYGIDPSTLTTNNFIVGTAFSYNLTEATSNSGTASDSGSHCTSVSFNPSYSNNVFNTEYRIGGSISNYSKNYNASADVFLVPKGKTNQMGGVYSLGATKNTSVETICSDLGIPLTSIGTSNFAVEPSTSSSYSNLVAQRIWPRKTINIYSWGSVAPAFNTSTGIYSYTFSLCSVIYNLYGDNSHDCYHAPTYNVYFFPQGYINQ